MLIIGTVNVDRLSGLKSCANRLMSISETQN